MKAQGRASIVPAVVVKCRGCHFIGRNVVDDRKLRSIRRLFDDGRAALGAQSAERLQVRAVDTAGSTGESIGLGDAGLVIDPENMSGSSGHASLTGSHWAVLRAFELGDFRLNTIESDARELQDMGLLCRHADGWRLTDDGQTLIALRRQI